MRYLVSRKAIDSMAVPMYLPFVSAACQRRRASYLAFNFFFFYFFSLSCGCHRGRQPAGEEAGLAALHLTQCFVQSCSSMASVRQCEATQVHRARELASRKSNTEAKNQSPSIAGSMLNTWLAIGARAVADTFKKRG